MPLSHHVYSEVMQHLNRFPGNYLEIGSFDGSGVAQIAQEYTNKIIYAVDPFIEDGHTTGSSNKIKGEALVNQKEEFLKNTADFDNVLLFEQTSRDFANTLTSQTIEDMNISWVTVDGSHHYDDVIIDAELALQLLNGKEGMIIFDDLPHLGVRQAYWEFLSKHAEIIDYTSNGEIFIANGACRLIYIKSYDKT